MMRAIAVLLAVAWLVPPAMAQTPQEVGEMRLYIQQLEERVRQLTGQNEMLAHELNQLRVQVGQSPLPAEPQQTGAVPPHAPPAMAGVALGQPDLPLGAPPRDLGTLSVSPDDPLIAPDGAPVDLSALATGVAPELIGPGAQAPAVDGAAEMAALPATPAPTTALSGSARDEYDLAYGYVLTGDYVLAEESFRNWLAAFPGDPLAADAQFWMAESHIQQGEYREAANAFLAVYKAAPDGAKGPDSLAKLGASLAALGEKEAACATLAEVHRRYPGASEALMGRVRDEEGRAGC